MAGQLTRVLVLSHDLIGSHMAGPGMRYWELARVLARTCRVTLAAPFSGDAPTVAWEVHPLDLNRPDELDPLLAEVDVVISSGFLLYAYPQLVELDIPWVIDAYIPQPIEGLAFYHTRSFDEQVAVNTANGTVMGRFLARGDFFLCASERQRDFCLGLLAAMGRLNPHTYAQDRDFRQLVDVVPFGLAAEPPVHTRAVCKGVQPGIGPDDRVLLWGGGIWDWLDPLTLIQAIPQVAQECPRVRLYFPGSRHPFRERVADTQMHRRAVALSDSLGLTGRYVFFGDWASQEDRPNYLLEADVGVSLHVPGAEARFAFRTRVLDYIWAGLPMILSAGDVLADLVRQHNLGLVVEPQDVEGVAHALLQLLYEHDARASRRAHFAEVASALHWEVLAAPLTRFCERPQQAADRRAGYRPVLPQAGEIAALHEELATSRQHSEELRIALQTSQQHTTELEQLVLAYQRGYFMRTMATGKKWYRRLIGRE